MIGYADLEIYPTSCIICRQGFKLLLYKIHKQTSKNLGLIWILPNLPDAAAATADDVFWIAGV
jgi:hypothetical protein